MEPGEVRKKGLFQFVWASAIFAVLAGLAYWLDSVGWHHFPWEFAIPAGLALAGLLQLVTGIPFSKFASQWDALKPWQRGVYGTTLVLVVFAVLFGGAIAFLIYRGSH